MDKLLALVVCIASSLLLNVNATNCVVEQNLRIDCHPESGIKSQQRCESRGCCYDGHLHFNDDIPWCFFPSDYPSYTVDTLSRTSFGYAGLLLAEPNPFQYQPYGSVVKTLSITIYTAKNWLRFQINDAERSRFQVPISTPILSEAPNDIAYDVGLELKTFGLIITRKSSGTVLFNSSIAPLLFSDQFLQISTSLPTSYIYGLGERHEKALVDTNWKRNVYWTRDQHPEPSTNLYGDHPFYIGIENDGNAHGVFFLNSNAKEVVTQPAPALTWRSIGGIFDFFVFLGSTPDEVVQQYTDVVGKPFLPPTWSLGFHLCRYGYNTSAFTMEILERMREASIPQDVQWNDIDYMNSFKDFTYDHENYETLPQLVENVHENGQHYVMIIDPGISNQEPAGSYPPYDDGIADGIFIKQPSGNEPIEGKVWPGKTVFPDFTHPMITSYWEKQLLAYHSKIPFDGVWIDMNEPSNFVSGSTSGCPNNTLELPPYTPRILESSLAAGTLCASSLHYNNQVHYNLHSIFGLLEMKATSEALVKIRNKRPFVISRSTFPSAGRYGGHWNGDIVSTWNDLKQSIVSVINFNMFGIPMVGADICGFGGDTTEELCTRWMQLGAFYPFSRNHNSLHSKGQAPVQFSETAQKNMRDILKVRYSYLPYLYSLFFQSHVTGSTVARGVFMEFPQDQEALNIDEQFMWGRGLLISPVLEEGATSLRAYFPEGLWYYVYGPFGKKLESKGEWMVFNVTLSDIFLHARGGSVLMQQDPPQLTTTETRKSPISLFVAPDSNGNAEGFLYWDDGDSLDVVSSGLFLNVTFSVKSNTLISYVATTHETVDLFLSDVYWFNIPQKPTVYLNGKFIESNLRSYNVLHFSCDISLSKPFTAVLK